MTTLTSSHSIEGISAADLYKKLAEDTLNRSKRVLDLFSISFFKTVVSLTTVHGHRWISPTQTQTTFEEHAVGESYSPNGRRVVGGDGEGG